MTKKWVIQDVLRFLLFEIESDPKKAPDFDMVSDPTRVWQNLVFCILSSQVSATTALRASAWIAAEIPFFDARAPMHVIHEMTHSILREKGIGHRFPRIRSKQIVQSWFPFAQIHDEVHDYLKSFNTEFEARKAIAKDFPGLGLKQSSMFLRDIGYSKRLCVIDTHVLWYMKHKRNADYGSLTPKKYYELEQLILNEADSLCVQPNILDVAIWATAKSIKANKCSTLFA